MPEVLGASREEMGKFLTERKFEETIKNLAYEMRDLYIKEKGANCEYVAYDGIFNSVMHVIEEIGHNNQ